MLASDETVLLYFHQKAFTACEWNHNAPIQVIYQKEEECNKCVNLLGLKIIYKLTELPRTAL